jgi:hypothetical protein
VRADYLPNSLDMSSSFDPSNGGLDADYDSSAFSRTGSRASSGDFDDEISVDLERGLREGRKAATCEGRCKALFKPDRWRYPTHVEARVLSWASIVLTLLTSIAGLCLAVAGFSAAMLAFALEAVVDIVSSLVILWRFNGKDIDTMRSREERSTVAIGLSFILLSILTICAALWHLSLVSDPETLARCSL